MPTKKPNPNGHATTLSVSPVAVVQRTHSEDVLRAGEDMWRLVADSAVDGIVVMREDGAITLWNRTAEAMFGWRADQVIGKKFAETILPPEHRETLATGLRRFLETADGNIFDRRLELSGLTKGGREFPIELIVVPHKTDHGHTFVGYVRDMTEQKKLTGRLRQSQKMEALGILAGGIAHDFNNILASIAGNVALARADVPADHVIQESLTEIEKATGRASYVVRQILTFSRAKETVYKVIDLTVTLAEAIKLLRATVPATMEIEATFDPDLPPILADSTEIHQIVLNLGINAGQALRGQSGKFQIQVTQLMLDEATAQSLCVAKGRYVRMSVGDTGCGMNPETLARIFDPFFTTNMSGEGTGLGLSVVYGIVTRQHGAISVTSEPGKGTVFHIYCPASEVPAKKVEPNLAPPVTGHGERILYVDDDEALVYLMTRMLRRMNYEVVGFQHSPKALEAFLADPNGFDLVITDMSMPHMDGATLVRELQGVRPDLPIVMVTGYIRPKDLEEASGLGISELILKPNSANEMGEVLSRVLAASNQMKVPARKLAGSPTRKLV